jgi:hypothetical protein
VVKAGWDKNGSELGKNRSSSRDGWSNGKVTTKKMKRRK